MIKSTDIRIGNWIYYQNRTDDTPKPFQVYTETFADIESTHGYFNPIPLTEGWIEKFSFEQDTDCVNVWFKEGVQITDNDGKWNYLYSQDGDLRILEIKYVHQLQNLYYSLIGEELNTK